MSKRTARLLLVAAVVLFVASFFFAPPTYPWAQSEHERVRLLRSRATEFYEHIVNGEYGELWEMAAPAIKRDIPKDEYVDLVGQFLEAIEFNYESPEIVDWRGNYGATMAVVTVVAGDFSGQICEKTLWVWKDQNWYFVTANLTCDFEPSEEEIRRYNN